MLKKIIFVFIAFLLLFFLYKFFNQKKSVVEISNQPMLLKKHSLAFNESIAALMIQYIAIKDAFVDADTTAVKSKTASFINLLNNIDTAELKHDTASVYETVVFTLNDIRSNALSLMSQKSIVEMRKDFSSMTDVMYPSLFYALNYEGPTLYLQNCPMAIDDSLPANWISNHAEVVNPYLGKNHPTYKSSMLHCGELKDSIVAK